MVVPHVLQQEIMLIQHFVNWENEEIVTRLRMLAKLQNELSLVDEVDVADQAVEVVSDRHVQMDEDTVVTEFFSLVKSVM